MDSHWAMQTFTAIHFLRYYKGSNYTLKSNLFRLEAGYSWYKSLQTQFNDMFSESRNNSADNPFYSISGDFNKAGGQAEVEGWT